MQIFKLYKVICFDNGEYSKEIWRETDVKEEMEYLKQFPEINIKSFIKKLEGNLKNGEVVNTLYGIYKLG